MVKIWTDLKKELWLWSYCSEDHDPNLITVWIKSLTQNKIKISYVYWGVEVLTTWLRTGVGGSKYRLNSNEFSNTNHTGLVKTDRRAPGVKNKRSRKTSNQAKLLGCGCSRQCSNRQVEVMWSLYKHWLRWWGNVRADMKGQDGKSWQDCSSACVVRLKHSKVAWRAPQKHLISWDQRSKMIRGIQKRCWVWSSSLAQHEKKLF